MDYYEEEYQEVSVLCSSCLCEFHTHAERAEHYASEWHIYNVKRKTAELPPIPFQLFNEKFTLVQKMKEEEQKRNGKITCPISNREFKSQAAYDHFRSSKEYARQYERFVKKQQQLQQQQQQLQQQQQDDDEARKFVSKHHIEYVAPNPEDDQPTENDLELIEQDKQEEAQEAAENDMGAATTTTTTTTTTPTTEQDKMNDEEDTGLEEGQVAIPLKYSLFDNIGPFSCARTAYLYMLRKYNFKLPFMDYLIDFEGLMEYLGAKVGIGHVCLNCNKRFETTIGCQQHMLTQNHAQFSLEQLQRGAEAEGEEDFVFQFYDFSHNLEDGTYSAEEKQQRQMQRLRTLLVLGKKTLRDIHIQEAQGQDVLSTVMTVPTQSDLKVDALTEEGDIRLNNGTTILSRKNLYEEEKKKAMVYYEKKNQAIMEWKLANKSIMTEEKEQELKSLKEYQEYWRDHRLRCGLRTNYILKKYFRKANQQNN